MSSSTVSITANPSGTSLRRHILTTDKKSALDSPNNNGTSPSPPTDIETTSRGGKATTHSIKEAVTETVQTRNPNTTSSTTKLRKRTKGSVTSSSRSPWKTAVSVVVKNLGLVVIVLLLIQLVRRLGLGFSEGSLDSVFSFDSDYERRVVEVERLVKTTTKLIQFQIDVVDKKVDNGISGLRTELGQRIDEVSNKFGELDGRIGSLEELLRSVEWLSKDEFDRFVEDIKGKEGGLKLDEVRGLAREIVEKEIGKHAADGIGRVDYAVASGGAMVLKHSEAFVGGRRSGGWFSGNVRSDAVKMLQPSFGQPGECFPFKGDSGFVEIKLRSAIVPEAITLEHVSKSVAFDQSTAPKDCKVWGWSRNVDDTQKEHLLTEFTYDLEKSSSQTFNVLLDTEGVNPTVIDTIRLQFMSNHGSPTHTCIYRVRVHGHQPNVS